MEIILLQDMPHLGTANSVVKVKPGYARNYLVPQGLAVVASPSNKNKLMQKIRQQEAKRAELLAECQEKAAKITAVTLRIAAKAGTSGKIFGSVNNVQIAQAIKEQAGVEIDRRSVTLPEEVKMLGTYTAAITLHPEVRASVKFDVFDDK